MTVIKLLAIRYQSMTWQCENAPMSSLLVHINILKPYIRASSCLDDAITMDVGMNRTTLCSEEQSRVEKFLGTLVYIRRDVYGNPC